MNQPVYPVVKDQRQPSQAPGFESAAEERVHRQRSLVVAFRLFGKFGFEEGAAGHITVRDPEHPDHFWVNPFGVSFKRMRVADLLLVDHSGAVVQGEGPLNAAAFAIHGAIHAARPDVVAAAHSHSVYGKAWSSLGRLLDPLTQDACAFYEDHVLFEDFTGVVLDPAEARRPERRVSGLVVHHHGAHLPGAAAGGSGRHTQVDSSRGGRADPRHRGHRAGRLVQLPAALPEPARRTARSVGLSSVTLASHCAITSCCAIPAA